MIFSRLRIQNCPTVSFHPSASGFRFGKAIWQVSHRLRCGCQLDPSRFVLTTDRSEAEWIAESRFEVDSYLFNKKRLYVTKNIPAKKLANAKSKFVRGMGSDESPLVLYDSTILGSCKEGGLLTNKAFYFSRGFDPAVRAPLEVIIGFTYISRKEKGGEKLLIKTKTVEYRDILTINAHGDNVDNDTAGEGFIKLLNDILDFLTSTVAFDEVLS